MRKTAWTAGLAMLLITGLVLAGCKGGDTTDSKKKTSIRWAAAEPSLRMRRGPGVTYQPVGSIPFGGKVTILKTHSGTETIGGKTDHWIQVQWRSLNGWVFGAFLASKKPEKPQIPAGLCGQYLNGPANSPDGSLFTIKKDSVGTSFVGGRFEGKITSLRINGSTYTISAHGTPGTQNYDPDNPPKPETRKYIVTDKGNGTISVTWRGSTTVYRKNR